MGIPFPQPTPALELQLHHLDKQIGTEQALTYYYKETIISTLQQFFGRTTRHPQDKAAFIILDHRIDEVFQNNPLPKYQNLATLLKQLKKFYGKPVNNNKKIL